MYEINKREWLKLNAIGLWNKFKRALGFKVVLPPMEDLEGKRQAVLLYANATLRGMISTTTSFEHFMVLVTANNFNKLVDAQWMVNAIDMEEQPVTTLLALTRKADLIDDRRFKYYLPTCEEFDTLWREGKLQNAPALVSNSTSSAEEVNAAKQYLLELKSAI